MCEVREVKGRGEGGRVEEERVRSEGEWRRRGSDQRESGGGEGQIRGRVEEVKVRSEGGRVEEERVRSEGEWRRRG